MYSICKLYLKRAENELSLAKIVMKLSIEKDIQINVFKVTSVDTYFNSVISNSYYSIFYSAKAYLAEKGVRTKAPEEHKKTFEAFKSFVDKGIVDSELLKIYENVLIKASILLGIFEWEKKKRGKFTYCRLPQANLEPAQESMENAIIFFKHIYNLCR